MKKSITLLLLLSIYQLVNAQKGFEKKLRVSEGNKPQQKFEEINGSKLRKINTSRFDLATVKKRVIKDEETGAVIFVENPVFGADSKNARKSISAMGYDYLSSIKLDINVKNINEEFRVVDQESDDKGFTHLRMVQKFKNIPIYGGEINLHTNKKGILQVMAGKVFPTPNIDIQPAFDGITAISKCLDDLRKHTIIQKNGALAKFLDLDPDAAELLILNESKEPILIYNVTVRPNILERWVYFINAKTGSVVQKYNNTCTIDGEINATARDLNSVTQAFKVFQKGSDFFMIDPSKKMYKNTSVLPDKPLGAIWTIDGQDSKYNAEKQDLAQVTSKSKSVWDPKAVSAHTNASVSYEYYLSKFNRNSLNNAGANIISVINLADKDGKGLDNAFWNGKYMGYGNGKVAFKPIAGALDIAGHEMTHGVIESTAKLEYRNQSGAINESMADVFGVLIDRNDWTLAEDIVNKNYFPSGALRSVENPNQGGKNDPGYQPKTMSQFVNLKDTPEEDNGGVHVNSGIPNFAFYKFVTTAGMTKDKAEQIYYTALTKYLTRTSKFVDLRLAVVQAAKDLYPNGQEANAAKAAFDFVGINDPNGGNGNTTPIDNTPNNTLPANPGASSLVVFDPRASDQSLYAGAFPSNIDLQKINNGAGCLGKPSVTDDGSFVYYVGKDKKVYRIDLIKKTPPSAVSTEAVWRNVAISKDGKKLAALTSVLDENIYIFDLVNGKSKKIVLFNPTYTEGVKTGNVLYADSFEWDYSGENIIYDAYNQVKSTFGDINYWDVGILRAWDQVKNTFGDGNIEKMFTNLDEGDNIGNAALAKTNSNIFAFDYFNSEEEVFSVIAIDFGKSNNNVKLISENSDVGYPDYSKDDKIIVFNSVDEDDQSVVNGVNMASDKISPSGDPKVLFTDAKWAVWYAQGNRALPTKEAQTISVDAIPSQVSGASIEIKARTSSNLPLQYTLISGDATLNGKVLKVGTMPGKIFIGVSQVGDNKFGPTSTEVSFCNNPSTPRLTDNGTSVIAFGGSLYQFFVNNNPVGGQTLKNEFKKDISGSYTVRAVTSDGCQSGASNSIGSLLLNNSTSQDGYTLKVSPNPVIDKINFEMPENETFDNLEVYDMRGLKIKTGTNRNENYSNLATGTYLIKLTTNKSSYSAKIIKR